MSVVQSAEKLLLHWRKQMEKELDWLYSSDCSLPGKERSEKILDMELLVKLFDKPENCGI